MQVLRHFVWWGERTGTPGRAAELGEAGAPVPHRPLPGLSRPALERGLPQRGGPGPRTRSPWGSYQSTSSARLGDGAAPAWRRHARCRRPGRRSPVEAARNEADRPASAERRRGIAGADGVFIARLRRTAPKLANAADLAVRFARMLRDQSSEPVADWLAAARSSVLKRFAAGLQRDVAGIENAIALPWSTGPAEGEISRLKTIKRQMYGRAGFELLRQRVLNAV